MTLNPPIGLGVIFAIGFRRHAMKRIASWLIVASIPLLVEPAQSQSAANYTQCNEDGGTLSPDARISGCTSLITAGRMGARDLAAAYNNRAIAYFSKGEYGLAIADYTKAIEINPTYAPAFYNRAISHPAMGDHDLAIEDLSKVIRIDPNNAAAYHNRAAAHVSRAIADYQRVLSIDPNAQNAKDALKRLSATQMPAGVPTEWCARAAQQLGNPWANPEQRGALLEMMRNRGCLN